MVSESETGPEYIGDTGRFVLVNIFHIYSHGPGANNGGPGVTRIMCSYDAAMQALKMCSIVTVAPVQCLPLISIIPTTHHPKRQANQTEVVTCLEQYAYTRDLQPHLSVSKPSMQDAHSAICS
jgi:hypothetical protein